MTRSKDDAPQSPLSDEGRDISSAEEMEKIAAELGLADVSTVKVYVRKYIEDEGGVMKGARVWDGPPGEYDLMAIARNHGSGDYEIVMRGPGASGKHVILGGPRVEPIMLTPEEENAVRIRRERPEVSVAPSVVAAPASAADIASAVAAALAPHLQRADPFEMLLKAKELFAPPPAAPIAAAPTPEPPSAMDRLTNMVARSSELKIMRGLVRDFAGEDGVEGMDEFGELLNNGGGMLKEIFAMAKQNRAAAQPEAAPIDSTATREPDEMNMESIALGALESAARSNASTDRWADRVVSFADTPLAVAGGQTTLEALLRAPDWFEALKLRRPALAAYQTWLTAVRDTAVEMMNEDATAPDAEPEKLTGGKKARKSR